MFDVLILGGGPAGLAATIYCLRKRLETLLVTPDLGGKTNYRLQLPFVEHHQIITGEEVVNRFVGQIQYLDFAHASDQAQRVETLERGFAVFTSQGREHLAQALIVATGARGQLLQVPGEREFMMRGLCYSAMSYAHLFIDRATAVVGDGDLALRSAAELATQARHVFLVAPSRGKLDSPLGSRLQRAANVTILEGYRVREVRGDRYARSVVVSPNGEERELTVDGIFVELELIPNSEMVAHLVELDERGRIEIDTRNRTSYPGIFAAGDVTNAFAEQVLIALGEGTKAALSAYEYLLKEGLLADRRQAPARETPLPL